MGGEHIVEEDVRALAAQLQRDRDQVLRRVLHDQPAGRGLSSERDLGNPFRRRQRLARLEAEPVDDVHHAGRQQVTDQGEEVENGRGRLLSGLEHHGVSGRDGRRQFPGGHQDREVPRDDLAHHTEWFVEVIGDGFVVDLGQRAFLRADRTGEVPEMVDGQRDIGVECLAHRLAVVPRFGDGDGFEVLLDAVGDLVEDHRPFRGGRLAPGRRGRVRGVERLLDVGLIGSRDLAERLTVHRAGVLEVSAGRGRDPLPADVVLVPGLEGHQRALGTRSCIHGHGVSPALCRRRGGSVRLRDVNVSDVTEGRFRTVAARLHDVATVDGARPGRDPARRGGRGPGHA